MKKIMTFFLFWTIFLSSFSQTTLSITGNIQDISTLNPVPFHAVIIQSDSSNGGIVFPYYNTVYSDNYGFYGDTITIPAGVTQWSFTLKTYDCMNNLHSFDTIIVAGTTLINHDFYLCVQDTTLPLVITSEASGITQTSAVLNGFVNPNGSQTHVTFEYGTTENYGNIISCGDFNGDSLIPVSGIISNLSPGTLYHFRISGTNAYGTSNGSDSVFITPDSTGCHAAYYVIPDTNTFYTYSFIDQSTGTIISWLWDFGDGTSSIGQNPTHAFPMPGYYNVCLTVQGSDSTCYDTYCDSLLVTNPGNCQAQFTYYHDSASTYPNNYHFVDLSLGTPTSWYWNFGDPGSGSSNFSSVQNPNHIFNSGDTTYYVCLTIQCQGVESTWCQQVVVEDPSPCINYFTYQQLNLQVVFDGIMLNQQPATYSWNFGDGQTSSGQSVSHTYASQGMYYVTLTTVTTDSDSCTYTSSQTIQVGDSAQYSQVYGQIFAGEFPMQTGLALIFSLDTINYTPYIDYSIVDSSGIYYFTMVPQGNYLIYAIPFTPSGYLPTYYGDVTGWENATVVSLGQPNNPYTINLVPATVFNPGNGTINGMINPGNTKSILVDKITMILRNEQGQAISFSQVDKDGEFDFTSLGYGVYFLHAELAGCTSDNVRIVITADDPAVEVNLTFSGSEILGTSEPEQMFGTCLVYPNPVKSEVHLTLTTQEASPVTIEILNIMGQITGHYDYHLDTGVNQISIPMNSLQEGLYTLRIKNSSGIQIIRKLLKTQ